MVGLFYKAVPVLADEDKIGGSAIIMIVYSYNDETMKDAYGCVFNILAVSFGQP